MKKVTAGVEQDIAALDGEAEAMEMDALIKALTCDSVIKCRRARQMLVSMGERAVGPLEKALASRKGWVRWEAAKALGEISGPAATDALLRALADRSFEVRWLAAEGLSRRGRNGLIPVLRGLIDHSDLARFRESAHHVLFDLSKGDLAEVLQPVLKALEDIDQSVEVPLAARTALEKLDADKQSLYRLPE